MQELIAEAAILALFTLSLDILATCGLVSFGHAGLLGVGCYMFAGLTVLKGVPAGLAFPAAVAAGALAARHTTTAQYAPHKATKASAT